MNESFAFLTMLVGLVVRVGIPIGLTAILIILLRRLDERWQKQAQRDLLAVPVFRPSNPGCWDIKHCSAEQRANCSAFAHPETPCWQHFRESDGSLQKRCLGCEIFKTAPLQVAG
jgi:hypothetical protein